MLIVPLLVRFGAALIVVEVSHAKRFPERSKLKKPHYPYQIQDFYQNQLLKNPRKTAGVWSSWSPWSPCSRSCGGGVTQQVRHCITTPSDPRFVRKQRRRRQSGKLNGCVGLYKRIHLCNNQDCPGGRDFRYEQCAAFNSRTFRGRAYQWEPYLQAPDECALNCRALGLSFYATLNRTVIDGTPCSRPTTSTGKPAPRGTRGVCIDGYCKFVEVVNPGQSTSVYRNCRANGMHSTYIK